MEIIDGQVHMGPGQIDATLAAMDALGLRALLIDEYWMGAAPGSPGYPVPDGAFRPVQPTAELAALLHPDRFSYLVRLDRNDREARSIIRIARDAPGARALRITPGMIPTEAAAFAAGGYGPICAEASDAGLPLFVFAPGNVPAIADYARRFRSLRIIVDHCGLISNAMLDAIGSAVPRRSLEAQLAAFDEVLALADLPNVALKWAHAPGMFEMPDNQGGGLSTILRSAIDRFGAERVMWASDITANQTGESWAELLFAIRSDAGLSETEQAAILGGTVRTWLDWPS